MDDKTIFQKSIGENLEKYRKLKGYTQSELAEKAGMSVPFYANLERGAKGLSLKNMSALATALDVSIDYLIFGDHKTKHIKNIEMLLKDKPEKLQNAAENVLRALVDSFDDEAVREKRHGLWD